MRLTINNYNNLKSYIYSSSKSDGDYGFMDLKHEKFYSRTKYSFFNRKESKKQIAYYYNNPKRYKLGSMIYIVKDKFTSEEIKLVDDLFNNLDEGNLQIIKGIINSKFRKHEIL